jgi:hypothetical protein
MGTYWNIHEYPLFQEVHGWETMGFYPLQTKGGWEHQS